jgi:DNA polymerase-1
METLMSRPTVILIDANNLAHRCMHAYKDLGFTEKNEFEFTGLCYGFVVNLMFLNKEFQPDHMIIVWDGGSDYRRSIYPQYKMKRKNRKKLDTFDYKKEMGKLHEVVHSLGIQTIWTPKEEADDVIGTLCKKLHDEYDITIYSNDHDFMQLLKFRGVTLYRSYGHNSEHVTKRDFVNKYGFQPRYYPNVLAIGGDKTDEYPGVKGISEETAVKLVAQFGPKIRHIYANIASGALTGRTVEPLQRNRFMLFMCKKLAMIKTNVQLVEKESTFDEKVLKELFLRLRFHSLLFDKRFLEIKHLPHGKIAL